MNLTNDILLLPSLNPQHAIKRNFCYQFYQQLRSLDRKGNLVLLNHFFLPHIPRNVKDFSLSV
jgi:hypothetical protein